MSGHSHPPPFLASLPSDPIHFHGGGWARWDYRGSFGVVNKTDGQPAIPDQLVVQALGLTQQP